MQRFENDVIHWAYNRDIFKYSNSLTQFAKLASEMGELGDNLAKGRDIRDDIGDCLVVLTIIAQMNGHTLKECANVAWNDIKDRKGKLSPEGVFIKEADGV
jgi:NTP pyrophosphatase (non-canonical NTP hydrolase)